MLLKVKAVFNNHKILQISYFTLFVLVMLYYYFFFTSLC